MRSLLVSQVHSQCKFDTFLWVNSQFFGEGNGTPLQYSCLENPMNGGAWWAAVHGVAKSRARLSDFTSTFHFHALEKEMATHSSVLPWRIPGTGEPGGLPSMGSHRVGHNWSDLAAAAANFYSFKTKKISAAKLALGYIGWVYFCLICGQEAYWWCSGGLLTIIIMGLSQLLR